MKNTNGITIELPGISKDELLEAALVGFGYRLSVIQNAVASIQERLGPDIGTVPPDSTSGPRIAKKGKRIVSPAVRKAISKAQKARWAKIQP